MTRCIVFLVVVTSCSLANAREYHYDRPQIPFEYQGGRQGHTGQPHSNYAGAPMSTVVRTLGPGGRNYDVLVMDSQQIYAQRQVSASAPGYHHQQAQYSAPPAHSGGQYGGAQVGYNQFAYNAGGQQNSGYSGQQYTTTNANPLVQNVQAPQQYQQLPVGHAAGGNNYAAPQTTQYAAAGGANTYAGPQAAQYAGGAGGQYSGGASAQYAGGAGAQYAGGAGAQYAGAAGGQYSGGAGAQYSGGAGAQHGGGGQQQLPGRPGDYVSQSEVGQLDAYQHKQENGDTRAFTRLITTCYPNGQCERKQLGPGQADPRHQHIVMATRARVQPVSDKCQRIAAAAAQGQGNYPSSGQSQVQAAAATAAAATSSFNGPSQPVAPATNQAVGPLRPQNRRLYPYTEVLQPTEPFN